MHAQKSLSVLTAAALATGLVPATALAATNDGEGADISWGGVDVTAEEVEGSLQLLEASDTLQLADVEWIESAARFSWANDANEKGTGNFDYYHVVITTSDGTTIADEHLPYKKYYYLNIDELDKILATNTGNTGSVEITCTVTAVSSNADATNNSTSKTAKATVSASLISSINNPTLYDLEAPTKATLYGEAKEGDESAPAPGTVSWTTTDADYGAYVEIYKIIEYGDSYEGYTTTNSDGQTVAPVYASHVAFNSTGESAPYVSFDTDAYGYIEQYGSGKYYAEVRSFKSQKIDQGYEYHYSKDAVITDVWEYKSPETSLSVPQNLTMTNDKISWDDDKGNEECLLSTGVVVQIGSDSSPELQIIEAFTLESGVTSIENWRNYLIDGKVVDVVDKYCADNNVDSVDVYVTLTKKSSDITRALTSHVDKQLLFTAQKTVTPSYSDSSSSSDTTTATSPEVVENADGSTTTTTTAADGTVTEVTSSDEQTVTVVTKTDGSKVETTETAAGDKTVKETAADGSAVETTQTSDGVTSKVETSATGEVTSAEAAIPATAAAAAQEAGSAVTLPLTMSAATSAEAATPINISVGSNTQTKVEIPVDNMDAGTVAIAVLPDGTEQIIKVAGTTEDGLLLNLEGDVQIKIVDNSKTFADVPASEWYADAVAFNSSREIMNGIGGVGATNFAPNDNLNRAMMAQVLYNLDNAQETGGSVDAFADIQGDNWYNDAISWAASNNYVNGYAGGGFGPDDNITREQVATILWRYAGCPTTEATTDQFPDGESVSDYARNAMAWAISEGIIKGEGGTILNPQGNATRAQIATMVSRYCQSTVALG